MIPSTSDILTTDMEMEEQPSKTYKMDLEGTTTRGYVDGLEAMKQVVFKILNTERYAYPMYSWDYGIETMDLYGEPVSYVCPELERRIAEALVWDDRIDDVSDFEFDLTKKGIVQVSFIVHTTFGDVQAERTVNF
jgi:hypothetical protein